MSAALKLPAPDCAPPSSGEALFLAETAREVADALDAEAARMVRDARAESAPLVAMAARLRYGAGRVG